MRKRTNTHKRNQDFEASTVFSKTRSFSWFLGQLKIVIPSFEHVEDESNSYILYSIHIYRDYYEDGRMNHEEWNIKRRYGRFKALLQILKIENPRVDLPPLPKTSLLKHMDHEYIQEKRIQLEEFLSKIIDLRNNNKLYVPATIEKDTLCIFLRGNCCFLQGVAKYGFVSPFD